MLIYKLLFTETSLFLTVLGSADLKKKNTQHNSTLFFYKQIAFLDFTRHQTQIRVCINMSEVGDCLQDDILMKQT